MDEAADRILSICRNPICLEHILQELFRDYGLTVSFGQYVLIGSTVRFCLSWLKDTGKMAAEFQDHMLLWQSDL